MLGRPRGNETTDVAFLSQSGPLSLGHQIIKRRMELRKNREQCAEEMGISAKTLYVWETNRYQPSPDAATSVPVCSRESNRAVRIPDTWPTGPTANPTRSPLSFLEVSVPRF